MASLGDFFENPTWPTPSRKWDRPGVFLSIFVRISLNDDPVPKNVLRAACGGDKLSSLDYLFAGYKKQGFRTSDLLPAFSKTGGPVGQINLEMRSSSDCDLKADVLHGMVKSLTNLDCVEWNCKEAIEHTS